MVDIDKCLLIGDSSNCYLACPLKKFWSGLVLYCSFFFYECFHRAFYAALSHPLPIVNLLCFEFSCQYVEADAKKWCVVFWNFTLNIYFLYKILRVPALERILCLLWPCHGQIKRNECKGIAWVCKCGTLVPSCSEIPLLVIYGKIQ